MAFDYQQLLDAPLDGAGSFGEGRVVSLGQKLAQLKAALQSGDIDVAGYLKDAAPFVQQAAQITGDIARGGSSAASAVNPIFNQLKDQGFIKNYQGQWEAGVPLSQQEYAGLTPDKQATLDQIQKGLVPSETLPGNMALNTAIQNQQDQQQGLASEALKNIRGSYDQYANDIGPKLTQQLTTGEPGKQLRNFYNSLGLLDSGSFNEGLANTVSGEMLNVRGREQSFLDSLMGQNYETLSGLSSGGLQRQFSLEDFYHQADLQKQLAQMQNDTYQSALQQQKMNPWTQIGMGFASGAGQGLGKFASALPSLML